jgi:RHS repeat-associated protein
MVTNTVNGGVTYYVYDGAGQRVMKQNWLWTTTYVYDAGGNPASEYTLPAAGATLPSGMTSPCGTAACYVTVDHLGSTRMVTDSNGNAVRRYDYLPSGEEIPIGTDGRTAAMGYQLAAGGAADGFSPKFTGQVRDWESGLDYFNARYYSAAQGRFAGVDPGNAGADPADPQTWNGYAYVGNNPLSVTDPTGEGWLTWLGIGLDIVRALLTGDPALGAAVGIGADAAGSAGAVLSGGRDSGAGRGIFGSLGSGTAVDPQLTRSVILVRR